MSDSYIKSHITIEEAEQQGLTQVAEQLRLNELTRKSLGLKTLQEEIKNPTKIKAGRPKLDASRKLIRVNTHNLT
tara:strand:- start:409 stop:633 length:225 start_codon:yes stop_codon:yes gene_type:complete